MTPKKLRLWDEVHLTYARAIARMSHDPKYRVGSVLVDASTQNAIAQGYNGRGKGRPNERLSPETGESGFAHSEMNAIGRASWQAGASYTLYTTLSPCFVCSQLIINNPIHRVVYDQPYPAGEAALVELQEALGEHNVVWHSAPAGQRMAWMWAFQDEVEAHPLLFAGLPIVSCPEDTLLKGTWRNSEEYGMPIAWDGNDCVKVVLP